MKQEAQRVSKAEVYRESVICRICHTEHELTSSKLCDCGTRLETTIEIKARIHEINRQAHALHVEALGLSAELFYRERRRTLTDTKGNRISAYENFWENVHGAPKTNSKVKAPKGTQPRHDAATREAMEEAL